MLRLTYLYEPAIDTSIHLDLSWQRQLDSKWPSESVSIIVLMFATGASFVHCPFPPRALSKSSKSSLLYDLLKNSSSLSRARMSRLRHQACPLIQFVNVKLDLSFCRIRTGRRHLAQERLSSGISELSDTAQSLRLTIRIIKSAICHSGRSAGASFTISANGARSILNGAIVLRYGKSRGFLRMTTSRGIL
jgi:hypothetical protein